MDEQDPQSRLRDLEAMLDALGDHAVVKLGPDGEVVRWSRGAQAMTGYTEAEVVGRSVSVLQTAEDRDAGLLEQELEAVRQARPTRVRGLAGRQER